MGRGLRRGNLLTNIARKCHEVRPGIPDGVRLFIDHFGRSSSTAKTKVLTQHFRRKPCMTKGLIEEVEYSGRSIPKRHAFLPDAMSKATVPNCGLKTRPRGTQL